MHRQIQLLDELENQVEDPDLLKGLFHVDHLATRTRRHAENLAVLGGAVPRRQWSHPVTLTEVLRSSIAEVEQYPRVKLVPPVEGTLRGHAVADVIHLLAELVENATLFSAPHTSVLLRAQYVTSGLAVEVEDRGLGMPQPEQAKMNALLSDPDQVNVAHLLQDGRIGLYVVAALARRHGIAVRLQSNIYGGVQAVAVIPQGLLGADPDHPPSTGLPQPAADSAPGSRNRPRTVRRTRRRPPTTRRTRPVTARRTRDRPHPARRTGSPPLTERRARHRSRTGQRTRNRPATGRRTRSPPGTAAPTLPPMRARPRRAPGRPWSPCRSPSCGTPRRPAPTYGRPGPATRPRPRRPGPPHPARRPPPRAPPGIPHPATAPDLRTPPLPVPEAPTGRPELPEDLPAAPQPPSRTSGPGRWSRTRRIGGPRSPSRLPRRR